MIETSSSVVSPPIQLTSQGGTVGSTTASFQIIPSLADFSIEKTDPRLPCNMMPLSRNRDFYGRTSILKILEQALVPPKEDISAANSLLERTHLKTFALCGSGGMGKTQLAIEFVHRHKTRFDAVLWIHADEPPKLSQGFSQAAVALRLVAPDSIEIGDHVLTRDLVLGWLANPLKSYKQLEEKKSKEASWLLVFDNVDNPDILDPFWPADSPGSVLITSRDPLMKEYIYSHSGGMALPPLDIEEATNLLQIFTNQMSLSIGEQKSARAVAEALGGLPLAITQMAGAIVRCDYTFSEFLDLYRKESTHTELFKTHFSPARTRAGYEHTIASVWGLENLKESAALLDVLSMLDPDAILEYILDGNDVNGQLRGYPDNSEAYQKARTNLLKSSLITREKSTKTIVIHRLIQDAARAKMSDKQFDSTFSFALCLLSAVWTYEPFSFGNETYRWPRCEQLFPHVLRLQKLFTKFHPPTKLSMANLEGPKLILDAAW